jgi:tRNA (guanine37-N1)-methyltransferase
MSKVEDRIAYDLVGNREKAVAIIGANYKANLKIAKEIMRRHKAVKSVLKKLAERKGKFRLYPVKLILGDKNTEVIHKEYGYSLKIDPQKVYFSPREGEERQRIAKATGRGERVLVMFCGAGPYIVAIAKTGKAEKVIGIDINPEAVKYAKENLRINKISNAEVFLGDVRNFRGGKFDRIVMPLAEGAIDYLDVAYAHTKKSGVIHLYGLSSSQNLKDFEETIKQIAKDYNFKLKIIGKEKVLPYAPRVLKVRFDLKVL